MNACWRALASRATLSIMQPSRHPRGAHARRTTRGVQHDAFARPIEWRTPFVPPCWSLKFAREAAHSDPSERLEETAAQGGALRVRRLAAPEAERAACAPWRPAARPCLLPPAAEASCTPADARRGPRAATGSGSKRPCCMPRICVPYASEVVSPAARQLTGVRARCHSSREARARRWRLPPVISPAVLPCARARLLDDTTRCRLQLKPASSSTPRSNHGARP